MAFLSDDTQTQAHKIMEAMTNTAIYRDELYAQHEETPIKISFAAFVGLFCIYYFLIK